MNAAETLAAVREAGISLRAAPDGASIIVSPSSRLTDPLRAAIRANKPQLVAALKPTAAYQAVSAETNGTACIVTIIELPQAQRYRKVFAHLQLKPPALVSVGRWQQAVEDGKRFLAKWGEQAQALGWSSADLFGLHEIPDKPPPSYSLLQPAQIAAAVSLGVPTLEPAAMHADNRSIASGIRYSLSVTQAGKRGSR
jgi:hypothetical protein